MENNLCEVKNGKDENDCDMQGHHPLSNGVEVGQINSRSHILRRNCG